jgi:hypothetical protein
VMLVRSGEDDGTFIFWQISLGPKQLISPTKMRKFLLRNKVDQTHQSRMALTRRLIAPVTPLPVKRNTSLSFLTFKVLEIKTFVSELLHEIGRVREIFAKSYRAIKFLASSLNNIV